jgi:hypothetical protein
MVTKKTFLKSKSRIAEGFSRVLLNEFDLLERHRKFVSEYFKREAESLNRSIDEGLEKVKDEEERAAYGDHISEEYIAVTELLPGLQWNAQFLVVYASFEYALNFLCDLVRKRSSFNLSFKDLAGNGIVRAADYLKKVASVETPFQTKQWQRALLLGEIRNAIAHRNGEIAYEVGNPKSLAVRTSKLKGLKLKQIIKNDPDAVIVLGPEFLEDAIADLKAVLADVANYELYGAD